MNNKLIPAGLFILSLTIVLTSGCKRDPFRVNLSGIQCDIKIKDLGKEIFETPPPQLSAKADSLLKTWAGPIRTYSTVVGLGNPGDEKWKSSFILYATDLQNLALWDSVKHVWPSLKPLEQTLGNAFRHYRYYFPDAEIPQVVTCVASFNNSIIIDDSLLMIGLDRYLGEKSRYYPALGIFEYQARKMTPVYTAPDCMYAWASTVWDYRDMDYGNHSLLTSMLHEAKLLYFTRCMLPEIPDTVLFGFKTKQLKFCRDNEARIWEYLLSKDILFSTDGFVIRKFTGEAPFTSYFTEESPGRAVVWTGYRIIERYMRNNRKVTLCELMEKTDCQAILEGARYNPD